MMRKSASDSYRLRPSRAHFSAHASAVTRAAFWLFLTLLLLSHASAANPGPFGWQPNPAIRSQYGWQIGPLALLPLLILGGWIYSWQIAPAPERRAWTWGRREITLPILGLSLLALWHILTGASLTLAVPLGLFWLIYLFLLNNGRAGLQWVLVIVLIGQSVVAVGQFAGQRPLNLAWLGEPAMDLSAAGTSVVRHNGANWLRAYGLNSHPNQLGLLLAALLLMLGQDLTGFSQNLSGLNRAIIWAALGAGLAGLAVSWSRAAWLGLLAGAAVYALAWLRGSRQWPRPAVPQFLLFLPLTAVLLIFLYTYSDIVANRLFLLDSELESWSLYERKRDTAIAWQIIAQKPVTGVGLGNYQVVAAQTDPAAQIVHNVPLLVAAELGLPGAALWLAFLTAPFLRPGAFSRFAPQVAVWLALIVISLAQPEPHLFLIKGAALWGLAAASWSIPNERQPRD